MRWNRMNTGRERAFARHFRFFPWAILVVLLEVGCYYDKEQDLYPNSFCSTDNITYNSTIEPIILRRCATPGCHVAGGAPGDFTIYSEVKSKVDNGRFNSLVIVNKSMPPSGPLSSCELNKLDLWIKAGAPNN